MTTPADRAVVRACLVEHGPALLAYFERRVVVREDAADLLGETMTQVWRRRAVLPVEPERRRMWLFTVAAHVLANQRRSSRRRVALADRLRQHLATRPSAAAGPADVVAVRDAVRRLPEDQRELVALVHWDGLALGEAAEVLGINPSTARGRYAAARRTLRAALADPVCS